ncbi:MAG: ribosome maturation factor RimP [Legionellales bacterium RIFCSPHIGHO2_12_FULL_37_14]|nr:MAG: ribosome maturation factor RimP [Legionellales bacterium RIFCSPHIGHO2_12_FULL_37_14]
MVKQEIEDLIAPVLAELGYVLWGLEMPLQGKNTLLRIYIDKPGGIAITDCERVSRQVSALLDVEDPILHNYTLEVSSPGIPRPLFVPEQYKAYVGHKVSMKLGRLLNGTKKFTGFIVAVEGENLTIKVGEENLTIPFISIVKANLIAE